MVMVGACDDSAFNRFCFQRSFLFDLNRYTLFGSLPDDIVEIIFNEAGCPINYVMSPIAYHMKYIPRKLSAICSTLHNPYEKLWDTIDKETSYKLIDDSMKVHFFNPEHYGTDYKCIIIENFDYRLLDKISRITPQRFMDFFEYLQIDKIDTTMSYHTNIHSQFYIFRLIVKALYNEFFRVNDHTYAIEEYMWWDGVVTEYAEDVEEEHGLQGLTMDVDNYLYQRLKLGDKLNNGVYTGDLIIMNDHMDNGVNLSLNLGLNYFYDRDDPHEKPREYYITKSDGEYHIRNTQCIRRWLWSDKVMDAVGNLNKAKKIFRRMLTGMKVRRERMAMNIVRYAYTGIEPTFNVPMYLHDKLRKQILGCCRRNAVKKNISQSFIYTANIFRINEYIRLKKLYEKASCNREKIFYLMKIGFIMRKDTRSNLYPSANEDIYNVYDNAEKRSNMKEILDKHVFLGCDKDEEIYINPIDNPSTYTRVSVCLESNMVRACRSIDSKWGYSEVCNMYRKYNKD